MRAALARVIWGSTITLLAASHCGSGGGASPSSPATCPPSEPAAGTGCSKAALACGYGKARISPCRSYYLCSGGEWEPDRFFQQAYPCKEVPPEYCPSTPPATGSPCTVSDVGSPFPCIYDASLCFCTNPLGGPSSPGTWACHGPPDDPACPTTLPNIGEACRAPGAQCNYPAGVCPEPPHTNVLCDDGVWQDGAPNVCLL
jgi:hypothetical protein